MATSLSDPIILASAAAGAVGAVLYAQAHVQARLLRRRIASGEGSGVVDPVTGLFAPGAAWQCIRAEANRAARLSRPLQVWVGAAGDPAALDASGRELLFELPAGATGIRLGDRHVCVVSCAVDADAPTPLDEALGWRSTRIEPDEHAAAVALAFVSEATDA